MKNLPYFRWYPADAETDISYASMSHAELGFFHRCLNRSWLNDGLPSDKDEMAASMRLSRKQFEKLWAKVGRCFYLSEDGKRYLNRRQEEERDYAVTKGNKNSAAAAHGQAAKEGLIYLILRPSDGAIKIGSTNHVSRRLAQLRYKYREELRLVCQFTVENMRASEIEVHELFKSKRINGEWFSLNDDDMAEIRAMFGDDTVIIPGGDNGGDKKDVTPYHPALRASDSESVSKAIQKTPSVRGMLTRGEDAPSWESINESWKWYKAEFPGDVNEFIELQLFLSVMETDADLLALRTNLPLQKQSQKWKEGFHPSSENYLSKRIFRVTPKLAQSSVSSSLGEYKPPTAPEGEVSHADFDLTS